MKRAYEVRVERGENFDAHEFVVVARTDEEAVRKAKQRARVVSGVVSNWRCTSLRERSTALVE